MKKTSTSIILAGFIGGALGSICAILSLNPWILRDPSIMSFLGSLIGGALGFLGAIIAIRIQQLKQSDRELALLVRQMLYAYNRVLAISKEAMRSDSGYIKSQDEIGSSSPIFLQDWGNYLIHLKDPEDMQVVAIFLQALENTNMDRDSAYGIGKQNFGGIEDILKKYDTKYLDGKFNEIYFVEDAYQ